MRDFNQPARTKNIATIAAYGPTASRATKYAVAIFPPDSNEETLDFARWHVEKGDIRFCNEVAAEIAEFLKPHNVGEVFSGKELMGCPHEEGIDYPLGGICPECPYWAETDRFTHGPKAPEHEEPPEAKFIGADEVIEALSDIRGCPPKEALAAADFHRAELTPLLLKEATRVLEAGRAAYEEDCQLLAHALYLFAKWQEPEAFPVVMQLLSLPGNVTDYLLADMLTEDGARILAAVAGGDRPEIRALIENPEVDEFQRTSALDALGLLVQRGQMSREEFTVYLRELITKRLEHEESYVWGEVATIVATMQLSELAPLLREAFEAGRIDPYLITLENVEAACAGDEKLVADFKLRDAPIVDVAEETKGWGCYHYEAPSEPERAEVKPGRNDQCPCGSGKKYKKCCGKNG